MADATPWQAGRFDARGGRQKILFGRMYEDAAIEASVFPAGGRVFCIASAGCMAISLASQHAVTAVDINPRQLAYAERRAAGAGMQIGSAERLVGIGRRLLALFGWRRRTLESFLDLEVPDEQIAFWRRHLDTTGFRLAINALLSVTWLRSVYAAPFLQVLPPQFGRVMRQRLERGWRTHPNRTNPYARALLLGDLSRGGHNAGNEIHFVCADAAAFLESCAPGTFDGFTLSNILDGVSEGYRGRLFAAVQRAATGDAVVVLRSFAEPHDDALTNQAAQDRSILWGIVDVRPVADLST